MKRNLSRINPRRLICTAIIVATMLLSCGLTAFAAEEGSPDLLTILTEPELPTAIPTATPIVTAVATDVSTSTETTDTAAEPPGTATESIPSATEDTGTELFPSDVQTITEGDARQIIKTYRLNADQDPAAIPRDSFTRDGWRFVLTDITMNHSTAMDTRQHIETVEIATDTDDLNKILAQLATTIVYESEDGYIGTLSLDLSTVHCEAAGYKNSSYTVTATREYPHLSTNDLALIPKSITENGKTLQLEDVSWEAQNLVNVDYTDIPDSYRAIAKYTTTASRSVTTGYITTAKYTGDISKVLTGDTVYTAYFVGNEVNPMPMPTATPVMPIPTTSTGQEVSPLPKASAPTAPKATDNSNPVLAPILIGTAVLIAALAGAGAFFVLRRNVKVYRDGFRTLAARDKINAKSPVIDLSPLEGDVFGIALDRFIAKSLNGKAIGIKHGGKSLIHQIAYEGNTYRIEVDFGAGTIHAVY